MENSKRKNESMKCSIKFSSIPMHKNKEIHLKIQHTSDSTLQQKKSVPLNCHGSKIIFL